MFSYLVILVTLSTVSALYPPSLDHTIITPQQLEWNGIYLPDLSCDPQACCCFTSAFQLIIGMNEQNETLIYIHGGNMTGSVNGSPCDFANTPLALPSESTPHIISKQVMDGSVLTHWYFNDNATALMVINGLQNPSVGSTCSFKATRQPDETSLSTPNAIDYTLFPYFPCGFQPCSQVPIQPYIQEWIGSYQPSNQIICDSKNPSCICFQRDISMSLTMGMDGSYNGMSLGGQYFNGQEWIHYQDEMILPSHSYTVPTEWHHMHYIFSLSANDTWIHLNAINQDISTCSFILVRPRTDDFSSITPHPKATRTPPTTPSTPEPTIRHQYSSYNYISTTGLSINSSSFISPSMIYIFIGLFMLQYFS